MLSPSLFSNLNVRFDRVMIGYWRVEARGAVVFAVKKAKPETSLPAKNFLARKQLFFHGFCEGPDKNHVKYRLDRNIVVAFQPECVQEYIKL